MLQLQLLWTLQCIDKEIYSCKKDISNKEMYNRLNMIKAEYIKIKELYDKQVSQKDQNDNVIKRLSADLKSLDQKLKDNNKRIYDEGDNIKIIEGLQAEIDECKSRIDNIENELLGVMDTNEKLNEDIEYNKRKLHHLKKEYDVLKGEYVSNNEDVKQKLEELSNRRKKVIDEIEIELIKQYNDMAGKKNNPVSQVLESTCMECGVKLNAMLYDTLKKKNQICKCDNCGRILYLE